MKYAKTLFKIFTPVLMAVVMSAAFVAPTFASVAQQAACEGSGGSWDAVALACTTEGDDRTVTSTLQQVGNLLIFIVGAISVIMVIIGGIRYSVAQGDQAAINSAKNTILYAIIGIVLAVASYGIVSFVSSQFD